MSDNSKAVIVAVMWFSIALMEIPIAENIGFGLAFVLPLVIAFLVTAIVWMEPIIVAALGNSQKAKRGSSDSLAVLMELMDEDEREAFKAQLKQRVLDSASRGSVDGELPLASEILLDEDETKYQHLVN